jgi:hypothetical protein
VTGSLTFPTIRASDFVTMPELDDEAWQLDCQTPLS